jgi:hypothetical protein
MTPQQARDYNILLELKERVESKYKDKNRINIINKKPRIIFMSNIEENKISDEAKQRAKNHMSLKGALEPKQETLEEAGKNTTKKYINEREKQTAYLEFIAGAKWQAERMYSEEEIEQMINSFEKLCYKYQSNKDWFPSKKSEWFKQFKKK